MDTSADFKSLEKAVSSAVGSVTRTAEFLGRQDLTFLRATDAAATRQLDRQGGRLLSLARRLCRSAAQDTGVPAPGLPNLDAVEEDWRSVADLVDHLLEKADGCLDELKGVVKQPSAPAPVEEVAVGDPRGQRGAARIPSSFSNSKLPKPQMRFRNPPDNHDESAFMPLLRTKPHAIESLEDSLQTQASESRQAVYKNPYEAEITKQDYPPSTFVKSDPVPYKPLDGTSATYVDDPATMAEMLQELKEAKEIAVDLEHHDTHSYIGIVCLMQISTRDKDWIVDTLKPWREDLQALNEVFADPRILKVFHGAASDIIWLQRDLGLYVVSLFDTYHASHALHYPGHGLAFLLDKFVNFEAQKKYQTADWRIRPLPQELLAYARSDTHFLLYIYDRMRNELLQASSAARPGGDLLAKVLHDSRQTALQRYERPAYDAALGLGTGGWYTQLGPHYLARPALLPREPFAVYRAVHVWRDAQARRLDESPGWLLPKQALLGIATKMPADVGQLAAEFGPARRLPDWLRPLASALLGVVRDARVRGAAEGPDLAEALKTHPAALEFAARKRKREERQPTGPAAPPGGVSAVLQREREAQGAGALLADASRFWGSTLTDGVPTGRDGGPRAAEAHEIRLHVPLPALTAEVFAASADAGTAAPATPAAPPEHAYVRPGAAGVTPASAPAPAPAPAAASPSDVLVLREAAAGSRKRKAPHDAQSVSEDGSADEGAAGAGAPGASQGSGAPTPSTPLSKKARKKARRRERKQQALENGAAGHEAGAANGGTGGGTGQGASADEPAFDYANAPSVLHAAPTGPGKSGKKGSSGGGGYDPYAKSLHAAPKGPKGGKPKGYGRSATFKG